MKVVIKEIMESTQQTNEYWVPVSGDFDIMNDNGHIFFRGYKNKIAFQAGAAAGSGRGVSFKLSDLSGFAALVAEIADLMPLVEPFKDGIVEDL